MKRRKFMVVLGGAAAWPLAARAQQADRMRRIGVLMAAPADDPEYQARIVALVQRLKQLGWMDGSNVRIDTRRAPDPDDLRRPAADLAALAPDVIEAATGTTTIAPLLQTTRIVPIVLCWPLTRSAPVSLQACPDQVATQPGSRCSNTA
jgi:putative ABC transport system substrate-binding protein